MYRDFQENTINSDGAFGMWISYLAAIYIIHEMYNYFLPWYWNKTATCKNGEEIRNRMRDALASTLIEETIGLQVLEWGFMPHDCQIMRHRLGSGLSHPDDVRAQAMSALNRRNRYREHYMHKVGDEETTKMVPW